ncbi:TIGR04222 domain-containing membrane protein [Amycolatopsis sp. 195334CR]|uniref:TIGR04222 domain-containing membrane protein n=1 Tax=Amycolatopsis sp. 195334CR TaxID=2814588 RepID=UPI001A8C28EF|nr:TIGR04222 domain-containing membrane protein [Amycolatopsis sp. 195334CR]MBN6038770.1 TIGR04222 domain-containing membrane protein [Amycolatopsis sp. 195334CR]
MGDPWGLSGPAFLALYAGCIVVPTLVLVVGLLRVRSGGGETGQLNVHQAAFLRGGPRRAAETVLAGLVDRGLLRVDSSGTLHATGRAGATQLERLALASTTGASGRRSGALVTVLADTAAMRSLRKGLVTRGLLVDAGRHRAVCLAAAGLYGAVLLLGLIRFADGVEGGFPVGYLVLMLLAVGVGLVVSSVLRGRGKDKPTRAGARARTDDFPGAAGAVAERGLASYPDREIASALVLGLTSPPRPPRRRRSNSSCGGYAGGAIVSGGCSSSGGSGCSSSSGGSSCGGGGGGCGGGGGGG